MNLDLFVKPFGPIPHLQGMKIYANQWPFQLWFQKQSKAHFRCYCQRQCYDVLIVVSYVLSDPLLKPGFHDFLWQAAGVKRLLFCGVGCQVQGIYLLRKHSFSFVANGGMIPPLAIRW